MHGSTALSRWFVVLGVTAFGGDLKGGRVLGEIGWYLRGAVIAVFHLAGQCRKVVEHELGLLSSNHHRCVEWTLWWKFIGSLRGLIFGVEAANTGFDIELFWPTDHLMSLK